MLRRAGSATGLPTLPSVVRLGLDAYLAWSQVEKGQVEADPAGAVAIIGSDPLL
jgi:hypothetical protein